MVDFKKIHLEVEEAQALFSACLTEAAKCVGTQYGGKVSDEVKAASVNAAIAMMNMIAADRSRADGTSGGTSEGVSGGTAGGDAGA